MSIVGLPVTSEVLPPCPQCGYTGIGDMLIHAADCPALKRRSVQPAFVACRHRECRRVLDPARVRKFGALTCNRLCRGAAWKRERNYGPQGGVGKSNGHKRASGTQISYRKAVMALARWSSLGHGVDEPPAEEIAWAESVLREALPVRQRAQVEARTTTKEAGP